MNPAERRELQTLRTFARTPAQREALDALLSHGAQHAAARALGISRSSLQHRIRWIRRAANEAPVSGAVAAKKPNPAPSGRRRYILTCAQNNTHVHGAFLRNLEAYAKWIGAEIKVARFSYNKAVYRGKSTKAGRDPSASDEAELWYDPAILPYVCDDPERHGSCSWLLAPTLRFCAEMNILPTAVRPLSGLDTYAGSSSGIFPHAKVALESIPVAPGQEPKFNYTTGAVTQRNYVQKKEGIKAEFHHAYAALLVEVDGKGNWWARHLNATDDGTFYDLTQRVRAGKVTSGHRLEAINWGDVHASQIDPLVRHVNWARDGVLDTLRPRHQFLNDLFSMKSRGHHELKSFFQRFDKLHQGVERDTVEGEVTTTAELVRGAARSWCQTVIVNSNHDRHGERWLDEADYKSDLPNAAFFLEAQLERVRAVRAGKGREWSFLEWALRRAGVPDRTRFLGLDESFVICAPKHPVECGFHGDLGPNGSRGTTQSLLRLSTRINKGHDHSATIRDGVASAGVCNLDLEYNHGPGSWSISHIGTYPNGKRVILTMRPNGKLWLS